MTDQCMKRGCDQPATEILKLCAPGPDEENGREAIMGVKLCKLHLDEVDAKEFVETAPGILGLLGLEPGDEDMVFADGIPLGSAEALAYLNVTAAPKVN